MLSYTGRRNLWVDITNNNSATHLSLGDRLMNTITRQILAKSWWFLFVQKDETTVANTQAYKLPGDCAKLTSAPYITISSQRYTPKKCPTRRFWDKLNRSTTYNDIPQWFYVTGNECLFWPIFSTSGNTITFNYRKMIKDLSIADYTEGTITTATNGSTEIKGDGTTWTSAMAGRYLKITSENGDGIWYKIASVTDNTTIVLDQKYVGSDISSGSENYEIGEMSLLPYGFGALPVYKAAEIYYTSIKPDAQKATLYKGLFSELYSQFKAEHGATTDILTSDEEDESVADNPNLYVTL